MHIIRVSPLLEVHGHRVDRRRPDFSDSLQSVSLGWKSTFPQSDPTLLSCKQTRSSKAKIKNKLDENLTTFKSESFQNLT